MNLFKIFSCIDDCNSSNNQDRKKNEAKTEREARNFARDSTQHRQKQVKLLEKPAISDDNFIVMASQLNHHLEYTKLAFLPLNVITKQLGSVNDLRTYLFSFSWIILVVLCEM